MQETKQEINPSPSQFEEIEARLAVIESDVSAIKERNLKVEADKAWETSKFRIFSILVLTYLFAALVLWAIGIGHYWQNALIPTLGYLLSTQSLPLIKKWWIPRCQKRGGRTARLNKTNQSLPG